MSILINSLKTRLRGRELLVDLAAFPRTINGFQPYCFLVLPHFLFLSHVTMVHDLRKIEYCSAHLTKRHPQGCMGQRMPNCGMRPWFDLIVQIPPYLLNEHYDDRYFDVVNAIEEAKHIFFRGAGIMDILSATVSAREEFRIGETGFGAGRLLIALMDSLDNCGIKDIAITYNSVELHPITFERMTSILSGFRTEVGPLIDLLVQRIQPH